MLKQENLVRLPEYLKRLWIYKPLGLPKTCKTCSKDKSSLEHVKQQALDRQGTEAQITCNHTKSLQYTNLRNFRIQKEYHTNKAKYHVKSFKSQKEPLLYLKLYFCINLTLHFVTTDWRGLEVLNPCLISFEKEKRLGHKNELLGAQLKI